MSLALGTRFGVYEVLAAIGAGGMGEVYRARDTKLGRDVALKILPESFVHDPDRVARFRREAQVLASLNHPHIAAIYGLEEANGSQFLVLELVEGETLAQRLKVGPLPVDEALHVARQIADALEAAHEKGIIHRDLKPANIAFTANGHVKVLDFGLAKATESSSGSSSDLTNSPLDHKWADHDKLHQWMSIYVRLFLGITLIGYGAWKVIPAQFQRPSLSRLLVPLGEMSPQALLWTSIGSSKVYTVFTGSVELLAGLLVLIPRTMTLGALLSATAMTNVLVLNMSYDVGVKLFSFHLVIMSVFLAAADLPRLANVFVFHRPTEAVPDQPLVKNKVWNRSIIAAQVVCVCYFAANEFRDAWQFDRNRDQKELSDPFHGIWTVDEFRVNGELQPPLVTDSTRWKRVVFDKPDSWDEDDGFVIQFMDGRRKLYFTSFDPVKHLLKLQTLDDNRTNNSAIRQFLPPLPFATELTIRTSEPNRLIILGDFEGQLVQAVLHREQSTFPIFDRGFHWTQFTPFWGR
jgi:serine/threonine protein kinase